MRLRLATACLVVLVIGGGAAMAFAAGHARSRPHHTRHCYARRHHRRVRVRCPKHTVKPAPRTHRTTTTTTDHPTTSGTSTSTTSTTSTTTVTSATTDYCTLTGLPHTTEVDESDQGNGDYVLAPACPHLASGSSRFNVYNFDSQSHNFMVENAAGQPQALTFAGGRTGTSLLLAPAPAGSSSSGSATAALTPGTYTLVCTLHPGMQATITVG